jgi:hypothetical protein
MRRQFKRFQIKSAIPLLSPIDSNHGLPVKPAPGEKGQSIQVYCNHFPATVATNKMLYQYEVIVEKSRNGQPNSWEEAMRRDQRRRCVQEIAKNQGFNFIYW